MLVLAAKLLLVPVTAYLLVSALGGNADLATLAFIVGAFPVGAYRALMTQRSSPRALCCCADPYRFTLIETAAPTVSIYGLRYAAPATTASSSRGSASEHSFAQATDQGDS